MLATNLKALKRKNVKKLEKSRMDATGLEVKARMVIRYTGGAVSTESLYLIIKI